MTTIAKKSVYSIETLPAPYRNAIGEYERLIALIPVEYHTNQELNTSISDEEVVEIKPKTIRKSKKQITEDQEETKETKPKIVRKTKKIDKDTEETKETTSNINMQSKPKVTRKPKSLINDKEITNPLSKYIYTNKDTKNKSEQEQQIQQQTNEETKEIPQQIIVEIAPIVEVKSKNPVSGNKCNICDQSYTKHHCLICHTSYVSSHVQSTCQKHKIAYEKKQPNTIEVIQVIQEPIPQVVIEPVNQVINTNQSQQEEIKESTSVTRTNNGQRSEDQHLTVRRPDLSGQTISLIPQSKKREKLVSCSDIEAFSCTKGCGNSYTTKGGCTRHSNKCTGPK